MSILEIRVKNTEEMVRALQTFAEAWPSEVGQAAWEVGARVLNVSRRMCPVDTGFLRGSAYEGEPVVQDGHVWVEIGYGADYSFWVHENLTAQHHPPTQAKFLEVPLIQAAPTMVEELLKRAQRIIAGGG